MRERTAGLMPWPVSAILMRTPLRGSGWRGVLSVASWARTMRAAAAGWHGVDGVAYEVVEDLADVVFEADDGGGGGVGGFDADAGVGEPPLVEGEDGVDKILRGDTRGFDGLTMEAEGLGGDLADAGELGLGELDVGLRLDGQG